MSRQALFDLAINRALNYAKKLELNLYQNNLANKLEPWYLKTRFAYRIPLEDVCAILKTCPNKNYYWQGGKEGLWQEGKNPTP